MKIIYQIVAFVLLGTSIPAFSQEAQWLTNYDKAINLARTEDKIVLIDFTGSDWCGWCMMMKEETLNTPQFKHYARENLILLEVDFPHNKVQTEQEKQQNQKLVQQFQIKGYPAFVLLDKDGKELGRQTGYLEGGPVAFISKLNTFHKPVPDKKGNNNFDSFFKKPAPQPTP